MKAIGFSHLIIFLFFAIAATFYHFKNHFNGLEYYQEKSARLEKQIEVERLNSLLAAAQLRELQQHVAEVLPGARDRSWRDPESGFAVRNLASVVGASAVESVSLRNGSSLYSEAQRLFRQKKNMEAAQKLVQLIESYPDSVHVVKAHFLLVESWFRARRDDQLIEVVERMVNHYPENEMTGFALLRLATIYEREERPEDALDIYNVVMANYSNRDLHRQARRQKREVSL